MNDGAAPLDDWQQAKGRLLLVMLGGARSDWTPTPERKELQQLAEQLRQVADRAEFGPAWPALEDEANAACAFDLKQHLQSVRALSDAASAAAARLPAPQARPWLAGAALLYLHLRQRHGKAVPSLYDGSEAVLEFAALLAEAGAPKAPETVRNLLSKALAGFDPFMPPPGLDELF